MKQSHLSTPLHTRLAYLVTMKIGFIFLLTICGIISFNGCSNEQQNTIIIQREWTPNAEYVGDVLAEELSKNYGLKIILRPGGDILDPISEVQSGRADIGVASADRILIENEKGANFIILAASTAKTPVTFAYKRSLNIRSPADFVHHNIGIQKGTNTELVLYALLAANHIDSQGLEILESGWDTLAFVAGKIDIQGVFEYDEPIKLRAEGVDIEELHPQQHGVDFVGTVYFANKSLLEKRPDDVQRFMNLLVEGWRQVLTEPMSAGPIARLKERFPEIDQQKEEQSFQIGRPYFEGDQWRGLKKPLYVDRERWEKMAALMQQMGKLTHFAFSDNVDYSYLDIAASGLANEKTR